MGVALYDEPIRVTIEAPHYDSRNGLWIGMLEHEGHGMAIVILEDGHASLMGLDEFASDFRYDPSTAGGWVDVNHQPDQLDE